MIRRVWRRRRRPVRRYIRSPVLNHFGSCVRFRTVLGDYWFWSWLVYPLFWPPLIVSISGQVAGRHLTLAHRRFFSLSRFSMSWSSHSLILAVWGRGNVVKRPLRNRLNSCAADTCKEGECAACERFEQCSRWFGTNCSTLSFCSRLFLIPFLTLVPSQFL